MRVTNSMISNSSRIHITAAKNELMKRENQYTTQKKILRPSDDPTIAIRALQLRTTYGKIVQYVSKNVKDAMEWMDTTEGALEKIQEGLRGIKSRMDYGSQDYLGLDERHSVLAEIEKIVEGIFHDNANADYAGRYMFTGYRTDTSLLFPTDTKNLEYAITEGFNSNDIGTIKYVYRDETYMNTNGSAGTAASDHAGHPPTQDVAYRLQLAYKNCSDTPSGNLNSGFTGTAAIALTLKDSTGNPVTWNPALNIVQRSSSDTNAYNVKDPNTGAQNVIYIPETGEVIFSEAVYQQIQEQFRTDPESSLDIKYEKSEFEDGDIRPEMYFECDSYDTVTKNSVQYRSPAGQEIKYEVNFSQTATVNVQARDAIDTDIYRALDYVRQTVEAMDEIERKIKDITTQISNMTKPTEIENLSKLKEIYEQEQKLRVGCMTEAFGMGLTMVENAEKSLNVAVADLGARMNRVNLTNDKLLDQSIDTEEKLSSNEDIDLADAYINMNQADLLYQAALSATAKILGNSLLNYI